MKIPEYILNRENRKDTELMDFIDRVRKIINFGRYQMRIVTSVPTWSGDEGEHLIYILGAVRRFYFWDSTNSTWQYIEWSGSGATDHGALGGLTDIADHPQYNIYEIVVDGSNYTTIQSAIDALPSGGGTVFIPAGTYTLTTPLTITKSNVRLLGGGTSTIITLGNSANCNILTIGNNLTAYNNIIIENIQFDGNASNQSGSARYGILFNGNITNSTVRGCYFNDIRSSFIHFLGSTVECNNNTIVNCCFDGAPTDTADTASIYFNLCDNNIIANNIFKTLGSSVFAIMLYDSKYNTVIGNTFSGTNFLGIRNYTSASTIGNNSFIGNIFELCQVGIQLDGTNASASSRYNTISGNSIYGSTGNSGGSFLIQSLGYYNTIIGNSIVMRTNSAFTQIGIDIGDYNIVKGNNIKGLSPVTTYQGIVCNGDYNIIEGNIVEGLNASGYSSVGILINSGSLETKLINNMIFNNTTNLTDNGVRTMKEFNYFGVDTGGIFRADNSNINLVSYENDLVCYEAEPVFY